MTAETSADQIQLIRDLNHVTLTVRGEVVFRITIAEWSKLLAFAASEEKRSGQVR